MESCKESRDAFVKIERIIQGGLDGNGKYFDQIFKIKKAYRCRVLDVDDKEHVDYCCGYGLLVFGHNDPDVTRLLAENIR